MTLKTFVIFEVLFIGFWIVVLLSPVLAYRDELMALFALLMFSNGLWHVVWWGIVKKYVPGLISAPFFIVTYLIFYFQILV